MGWLLTRPAPHVGGHGHHAHPIDVNTMKNPSTTMHMPKYPAAAAMPMM